MDIDRIYKNTEMLNLAEEERNLLDQQIKIKIRYLIRIGWSNEAIAIFLFEINKNFQECSDYKEAKDSIEEVNNELHIIGSYLFTEMLESDTGKAIEKIKLIQMSLDLEDGINKNLREESKFFDLINSIVVQAVEDGDLYQDLNSRPGVMDYFVLTTLNQLLNNLILDNYKVATSYEHSILDIMFENDWQLCNHSSQNGLLNSSRYHAIGEPIPINEKKFYDPAYNVKILSANRKFERIYNMDLGLFLDEIYRKYPYVKAKAGYSTNLATYNYGFYLDQNCHALVDVEPYNVWGNDYECKKDELELYNEKLAKHHESKYAKSANSYVKYWDKFHENGKSHASQELVKEKIKEIFGITKEKDDASPLSW
ncbi:MAG: hypothetical protein ACK5LM_06285 [Lactovum sp.]